MKTRLTAKLSFTLLGTESEEKNSTLGFRE